MSDTNTTKTAGNGSKAPAYLAYAIRERGEGAAYWTRIGAAWAHADSQGFSLQLEAVPLDGRVTLRLPSEKAE